MAAFSLLDGQAKCKFGEPLTLALIDPRCLLRDCVAELLSERAPDLAIVSAQSVQDIVDRPIALIVFWIDTYEQAKLDFIREQISSARRHHPQTGVLAFVSSDDPDVFRAVVRMKIAALSLKSATSEIGVAAIRLAMAGEIFASSALMADELAELTGVSDSSAAETSKMASDTPCLTAPTAAAIPGATPNCTAAGVPSPSVSDLSKCALPLFAPGPSEPSLFNRVSSSHPANGHDVSPKLPVTPRELELLQMVDRGLQNKVIAYQLGISESTVKVHLRNLMRKLNANNRTQVAFIARQNGPQATSI